MIAHDSWWSNERASFNYYLLSSTSINYHVPFDQGFTERCEMSGLQQSSSKFACALKWYGKIPLSDLTLGMSPRINCNMAVAKYILHMTAGVWTDCCSRRSNMAFITWIASASWASSKNQTFSGQQHNKLFTV